MNKISENKRKEINNIVRYLQNLDLTDTKIDDAKWLSCWCLSSLLDEKKGRKPKIEYNDANVILIKWE